MIVTDWVLQETNLETKCNGQMIIKALWHCGYEGRSKVRQRIKLSNTGLTVSAKFMGYSGV